jgi:hemoglobin-like flavoprotein
MDPTAPDTLLTANQRRLIRETSAALRSEVVPVSVLFYRKLFELDPSTRRMFSGNLAAQGEKLVETLDAVVASIDDFEAIRERLRLLGRQHAGYGVTPRHYELATRALLWTLSQAIEDLNAETREAWQAALPLGRPRLEAAWHPPFHLSF